LGMAANFSIFFWLSLIFGAGAGSMIVMDVSYLAATGVAAVLAYFAAYFRARALLYLMSAVCGAVIGINLAGSSFEESEYRHLFGQTIDVEGFVSAEPPSVSQNQQLTIMPDGYRQKLRASVYVPVDAHKGDRIWIRGVVMPPENFDGFDYIGYLQRHDIYGVLKKPRIIVLERSEITAQGILLAIKSHSLTSLSKNIGAESSGLVVGMLIGEKGGIPKQVTENFRLAGLSHIVAVSGYNMTIIAGACSVLAWYIGRKATGIATVMAIVGFAAMAGGSASIVRSAIMALLAVIAQLTGRMYTGVYALAWAAGLMVVQNPRIVLWDVGFQLSVAATLGVLVAYRLKGDGESESMLRETMRPTIGAIIATSPLVAMHFNVASLVSPVANALLLPLVPWIMLFGALAMLPLVGTGFGYIAGILAGAMTWIAGRLAAIPYATVPVDITPFWVIILYLLLSVMVNHIAKKRPKAGKGSVLFKPGIYDKI
jgi:competence protein ComEC